MNRILLFSSAAWLITSTAPVTAAVFERDWKTPGDGLLTFDDVNQREWLDLSVSRLDQFPEPRLENAIAELTPGGLFEGFTWAKRDDVIAFAQSAAIDTSTSNIAINQIPITEFINLLGSTAERDESFIRRLESVGFIDEAQISGLFPPRQVGALFRINFNPATGDGYAGLFIGASDDSFDDDSTGLMLYRVVPEPSSTSLAIIGMIIFICSSYRATLKRSNILSDPVARLS